MKLLNRMDFEFYQVHIRLNNGIHFIFHFIFHFIYFCLKWYFKMLSLS